MDIYGHNQKVWDKYVRDKVRWTVPVSDAEIAAAKRGEWNVILTPTKGVPQKWFPEMHGTKILGLASSGGQQGPVLAAAGAEVTIFDQSENQLHQDRTLSEKHQLGIRTLQGDMRDLSVFEDNTFDVVFNPCSVVFVEELESVWRECHRVLKPGGVLMSGLINPVIFQLEQKRDAFRLAYPQPFSDIHSLPKHKLDQLIANNETLEFGHTLTDQIGGQLNAGFVVTDFYEDDWNGERDMDKYLPSFFATRAVKR